MGQNQSVAELLEALSEFRDFDSNRTMTLPPDCFTSEKFLEFEREEIFRKEWICLGRVDEIPNSPLTKSSLDEVGMV